MFEVGIIINSSHFSYCLREEKSKNFTKFRAQVYKKKNYDDAALGRT